MKGFKDTTRVQYFKGGAVTREKACGGMVKKAEGGRVTDPVKNKTGGKNDPEYGDYAISKVEKSANRRTRTLSPNDSQYSRPGTKESMGNVIYDENPKAPYPNSGSRKPMKKAEGGKVDMKQDKKTVAAGVHKHERALHPGKPMTKMQRGGFPSHSKAPLIKAR